MKLKQKNLYSHFLQLLSMVFFILLISCSKKSVNSNTVTDIDGNVYHTVKIGSQTWMVENLKVTHYRNGDAIPNVTDSTEWNNLKTGAYCDPKNDPNVGAIYGKLYNGYAVMDNRGLAPTGWHIPNKSEWDTLINFLGGTELAGGNLKESGYSHWQSPNAGANNSSGFTALPAGYRYFSGNYGYIESFGYFGLHGYWWTSTEITYGYAWYYELYTENAQALNFYDNELLGFSVRCIKDE